MPSSPDSTKSRPARRPGKEEGPAIQFLRGVGPARAKLLGALGIGTPLQLLHAYPRLHEDRRTITPIASLLEGVPAVVRGRVVRVSFQRIPGRGRRPLNVVKVAVADDSGSLEAEWWNQPYRKDQFHEGDEVVLSGKAVRRRGLRMSSPETEVLAGTDTEEGTGEGTHDSWGRIVPLYPLTKGLRQHHLRRAVREALARHLHEIVDPLPESLRADMGLAPLPDAVASIHFPADFEALERAKRRLRFEELLFLQLALALRRRDLVREERGFVYHLGPELDRRIRNRFPFAFTKAQDRVVGDLLSDFGKPHPMNRILQGDVGSGKTAVALYAMLTAVANRRQAALLAPTEILAEQHFQGFRRALEGSRVRLGHLEGGMAKKARTALLGAVAAGDTDILVTTHAVLEKDVAFHDLGMAVVDEQHRFGVHQRRIFREKGLRPDLLYLTATPIPRTLSLTLYGDLDSSVLDERPPGRKPVRTLAFRSDREGEACEIVRAEAAEGRQAFFICPLVEESEELDLRAAVEEAERLRTEVFPDLRVGLLHGRMKGPEKKKAMEDFRAGRTHVLVSTVVVEVGVDIPNATVLAVLHAERFGLSQLHQLRGRIGRGPHPSTCMLFTDPRSEEAKRRIDALLATDDGFEIARRDLEIRGPGEFFGTRQSGLPDLRMPDALFDAPLLDRARREAHAIIEKDPDLSAPGNLALRTALLGRFGDRIVLARV